MSEQRPEHDPEHERDDADERSRDSAHEREDEGGADHIPIEPTKRPPAGKITKQSLLDLAKDEPYLCPSCGAELPDDDATLCLKCGYDLKANRKLRTQVGVEEVEEAPGDFSEPGWIPWQATLGAGGAALLIAAVIAFTQAEAGALREAMRIAVHGTVHVGLGVVSVIVAALLLQQRFGRVEFAVGRMALAVGGFVLAMQLGGLVEAGATVRWLLGAALGAGIYILVVWRMFATTMAVVGIVAGLQFTFWLLLELYATLGAPVAPAGGG